MGSNGYVIVIDGSVPTVYGPYLDHSSAWRASQNLDIVPELEKYVSIVYISATPDQDIVVRDCDQAGCRHCNIVKQES